MEKCGGEISYKKSFGLGGASFTVTIPKKEEYEKCSAMAGEGSELA
jgi:hypothetical protein